MSAIARVVVGVLVLTVCSQARAVPIAGPITNPANGHRYYLLPQSTWTNAEAGAISLGGHLVTIDDAAEDAWVFDTFNPLAAGNTGLWIGLNDAASEGIFTWASGEPVNYTNWATAEPNNTGPFGQEDFVHIVTLPFEQHVPRKWNDVADTEPNRFGIVEVVPEPASPPAFLLILAAMRGAAGGTRSVRRLGPWISRCSSHSRAVGKDTQIAAAMQTKAPLESVLLR